MLCLGSMISDQEELPVPVGRNIKDTAANLRIEINLHPTTKNKNEKGDECRILNIILLSGRSKQPPGIGWLFDLLSYWREFVRNNNDDDIARRKRGQVCF